VRNDVNALAILVAPLIGAVVTMPIWTYSQRWKLYPSSVCFGLAATGAALIAIGAL